MVRAIVVARGGTAERGDVLARRQGREACGGAHPVRWRARRRAAAALARGAQTWACRSAGRSAAAEGRRGRGSRSPSGRGRRMGGRACGASTGRCTAGGRRGRTTSRTTRGHARAAGRRRSVGGRRSAARCLGVRAASPGARKDGGVCVA
eukprot:4088116-Prymnesium_polylepis.1